MQEFSLLSFVERVRQEMFKLFPYENDTINEKKHKGRTGHIAKVAFMDNPLIVGENTISFDIGNARAEAQYPYYHILQDAPVIHKKGRATEKSRGSQAKVENLAQRDYGRVSFNGKTYSKEYAKNIRGKRYSVVSNSQRYIYSFNGHRGQLINREADTYKNIHYHYIDNILDIAIRVVAPEFGYRLVQVKGTSLKDDYDMQEQVELDSMLEDMINSYRYDEGEEDYE